MLTRITNLDCFTFGNYKIKIKMTRRLQSGKANHSESSYAIPYMIPRKPPGSGGGQSNSAREGFIDEAKSTFVSQSFLFRNSSENVCLEDRIERSGVVQVRDSA